MFSRLIRARMHYICTVWIHSYQIMHCQLVFYVQMSQIIAPTKLGAKHPLVPERERIHSDRKSIIL